MSRLSRPKSKPPISPPLIPFVVSVGVTGHRGDALGDRDLDPIRERLRSTLVAIEKTAAALLEGNSDCFAPGPPLMRLVSPLADGADQLAAEIALSMGWDLQAILPFARAPYRASLRDPAARKCFDQLVARSSSLLELPGDMKDPVAAYVMTGRGTIAHADLLIALWDGKPSRGPGGTADVVQQALSRGTGIVHVPVDRSAECRMLWSAFDPMVLTLGEQPTVTRPFNRAQLRSMLGAMLLPPGGEQEQKFLRTFRNEPLRNFQPRIEYPLLLAVTGVRGLRARDFDLKHCDEDVHAEWSRYRKGCLDANRVSAPIEFLEQTYAWADRLASNLGQTYRSGHIFNFVLGAVAVCMGLATLMAPEIQFQEAVVEMLITVAIIANSLVGSGRQWHRRWLDYRQLAERLRPMRSLELLGIAAPDLPGSATSPVPRRWMDWYAMAAWRAIGVPSAQLDSKGVTKLGRAIAKYEVRPQMDYHRRNAMQIQLLDQRLGRLGLGLFGATLLVSVITLIGFATNASYVSTYSGLFTLIQAGFPALGTAVFGIRFQGDFGGDAVRSLNTAATLEPLEKELRKGVDLQRAADVVQQCARIMLADLDEWRLVNQQRDLDL